MTKRSGLAFDRLCELTGLPKPVPEYRFHPTRKWRFDWAFVPQKLALEREGGVFMKGGSRHSRGAGFRSDLEKYNEAAAMGWRVIRVLPEQMESTVTYDYLRRALL